MLKQSLERMNKFKTKYMLACLDNGGNEQGHQVGPNSGKMMELKVEEEAQKKKKKNRMKRRSTE